MSQKMILLDSDNNEIECNVIAKWSNNNINYVAYTDGSITDGKLDLLVSRYVLNDNNLVLENIDDDNEWEYVNNFLDEFLFDAGDEDNV